MTVDPIFPYDTLTEELIRKQEDADARKGATAMHSGAFRTDKERIASAL